MNKIDFKYFVGKICTIFVNASLPRSFTDEQFADYFVGVVEGFDNEGIITTHALTGCKNYFNRACIVAICEEQVLNPENPQDAALIEEIKNQKKIKANEKTIADIELPAAKNNSTAKNDSTYVDIDLMNELVKQAKAKN